MNKTEKLKLIEGDFSIDEAKDILDSIFLSKINFHKLENLCSQVRTERCNEISQMRISELKEEMEKLKKIFIAAKAKNKRLFIDSQIIVSLSEEL
jgi:hypothetical protein